MPTFKRLHLNILKKYVEKNEPSLSTWNNFDIYIFSLIFIAFVMMLDSIYVDVFRHQHQSIFIPFIFCITGLIYFSINKYYEWKALELCNNYHQNKTKALSILDVKIEQLTLIHSIAEVKNEPIKKVKKI
jgi:hypothetical protein